MSETATERPAGGGGLDQVFSRKYGPLPGWGWAGIAAGSGYLYYKHKQAVAASAASTTSAATTYSGYDYGPQIATIQSEVQGLQSGEAQETTTTPPTTTTSSSTTTPTSSPSTGPAGPSAPIPKVTGKTAAQARSILANAGFNVGGGNANAPAGQIIRSQTPAAGTRISYGSAYWPLGRGAPTVDIG